MSFRKVARMRQVHSFGQPGANECPLGTVLPELENHICLLSMIIFLTPDACKKISKTSGLDNYVSISNSGFLKAQMYPLQIHDVSVMLMGPQLILMNSPY